MSAVCTASSTLMPMSVCSETMAWAFETASTVSPVATQRAMP
jgi:hypothetical protein